jgi:flagellar biosynthesis protein FliR
VPDALSAAGLERGLSQWVLLWARLAPLFLLAPWLVARARPGFLALALSAGGACALWPLAWLGEPGALPWGLPLMAAGVRELVRGSVLALGCALPFSVFESTGVWADSLRGGLPVQGGASVLGKLYLWSALVLALLASAQLGVVRLFVSGLQSAPLGTDLADAAALRSALWSLAGWLVQAFELSVRLAAPLLLAAFIVTLLVGLSTRVAASLIAPLGSTALLPWLGLGVVCLCTAGILDELPSVVRLFDRETARVLDALH